MASRKPRTSRAAYTSASSIASLGPRWRPTRRQARFGKRPRERAAHHGHLAGGPLHSGSGPRRRISTNADTAPWSGSTPTLFAHLKALPWAQVPAGKQIRETGHGGNEARTVKAVTVAAPGRNNAGTTPGPRPPPGSEAGGGGRERWEHRLDTARRIVWFESGHAPPASPPTPIAVPSSMEGYREVCLHKERFRGVVGATLYSGRGPHPIVVFAPYAYETPDGRFGDAMPTDWHRPNRHASSSSSASNASRSLVRRPTTVATT
jgi:hypothetical protein